MMLWEIQGIEMISCNCLYGCFCQFNVLLINGNCEVMGVILIDSGYYGDVVFDGVRIVVVFQWLGVVYEGKGKC